MDSALCLGRNEHFLDCSTHSSEGSHQRSGDAGGQNLQKQPRGDTMWKSREKVPDELFEIILETFKEWPFGNQLPYL